MAHHTYKSDGIMEALCEIHFASGSTWDPTVFGSYYDIVKESFPKKQVQETRQFQLQAEQSGIKQSFGPPQQRMQFLSSDDSMMVQIARELLVVNILRAYPSWDKFKPLILSRVADYFKAANPRHVSRIGLRYINRYEFPVDGFDVQSLFNVYPRVPGEIDGSMRPFLLRVEHHYSKTERLVLTFGETDSGHEDVVAVMLDLDHVFLELQDEDVSPLDARLELAHDRIEGAFEACITDKIRALLDQKEG